MNYDPATYEGWYHTPRGGWIARREFDLMWRQMRPHPGETLLDVGTGTGHFARRFAAAGLRVTGLDPDATALDYARRRSGDVTYLAGAAAGLPFPDARFDYCTSVTSLCFVAEPAQALREMWRVCRRGALLGLLNRRSLLFHQAAGRGGYRGARWDRLAAVHGWAAGLEDIADWRVGSAVFLPGGGPTARLVEQALPSGLLWGGFLSVYLTKAGLP